jgi:cysteine protease ATG4
MVRTRNKLLTSHILLMTLYRGYHHIDWRIHPQSTEDMVHKYRTILSWFADEPERYYSIHNIAKSGLALDKRVGEWFGPSTVAHSLR